MLAGKAILRELLGVKAISLKEYNHFLVNFKVTVVDKWEQK